MASLKMVEISGAQKKKRSTKLTMEAYFDLLHADREKRPIANLTVDQLNQVIDMHGFVKSSGMKKRASNHKVTKGDLAEILGKMELVDPSRSTVDGDGVTSDAELGFEDVIKDLSVLNWMECSVTSLQILKAVSGKDEGVIPVDGSQGTILSTAAAVSDKQKSAAKRGGRIVKKGSCEGAQEDVNISGGTVLSSAAASLEKQNPEGSQGNQKELTPPEGRGAKRVSKASSRKVCTARGTGKRLRSPRAAEEHVNGGEDVEVEEKGTNVKDGDASSEGQHGGGSESIILSAGGGNGGSDEGVVQSSTVPEKQPAAGKRRKGISKGTTAATATVSEKPASKRRKGISKGTVAVAAAAAATATVSEKPAGKRRKGINLKVGSVDVIPSVETQQ